MINSTLLLPQKMKNMMKDNLQVPETTAKRLTFSVGVGSAVFGLLSYACSSTFKHLFGEWNWWKIILYAIFSLITLVAVVVLPMLTTPPDLPRFGEYAGLVKIFVLVLGSLYTFFVHRHNEEEDGDFALASYIAFVITWLCCGLEALMCFFLQITFIHLLKIYWVLGAVAMGISSVLIEGPPQKYLVEQMGNREEVVRLVLVAFLPVESWGYVLVEYFHDDKQKLFKIIIVPIGFCYFLCFPYLLTRIADIWKISRLIVLLRDYVRFIFVIMSFMIMYYIWEGISDYWVTYYFCLYFFMFMYVGIDGRQIFILLDLGIIYVTLVLPISFEGLPIMNQLLLGFSFIGFCCSLVIAYLSIKYGENYQDHRPGDDGVARNNVASSEASTSTSSQKDSLERPETSSSSPYLGVGLENLGNTCFMNVILQCFTHTVPFVQQLRSFNQHTPCSDINKGLCVLGALCEIIDALLLNSSGEPVHPRKLANNLSYFSADFVKGRQCDAHEFMQCALEKLKECLPDGKDNLVDKIFSGEIVSKFSYSGCDHDQPPSYTTPEPLNLMLDIDGVKSVEKALKSFFKVDKTEQITCDTCEKQVSRRQQLFLNKTPKIAALKLNRIKKDEHVEFPIDLDLKPYYANMDSNENVILKYYLYAVVVHSGKNLNSGHYYCFVRTSENNWCKYDDSKATEVSESEVLAEEAYILFYAQQGTPWFVNSMSFLKDTRMDENVDQSKVGMPIFSDETDIRKNLLTRTQKSGDISSPRKRRAQIPI